jgi:hypothetical protein
MFAQRKPSNGIDDAEVISESGFRSMTSRELRPAYLVNYPHSQPNYFVESSTD